jgi:hypothetical protein
MTKVFKMTDNAINALTKVCPFVLFILDIELSVFFLFTVSEYILGIFKKLFNNISVTLWLAVLLVLHMMSEQI